jgi:ribosomal protein S18 acetylase RimI-like enzyme
MTGITRFNVHTFTPQQAGEYQEAIVDIYQAAFSEPPYDRTLAEVYLFRSSFSEHRYRAGFHLAVALDQVNGAPVGFAYGYTCAAGQWWYERLREAAGPDFAPAWLNGSFQVAEVAVHPRWQGRGPGGQVFDRLLVDRPHPRAVLSTIDQDTPASRLYQRRGWQVLLQPMYFPSVSRPYKIMGRRLDKPAAPGADP